MTKLRLEANLPLGPEAKQVLHLTVTFRTLVVIPAKPGTQARTVPAFAGMTRLGFLFPPCGPKSR